MRLRLRVPTRLMPYVMLRVLPLACVALVAIWIHAQSSLRTSLESEIRLRVTNEAKYAGQQVDQQLASLLEASRAIATNDLVITSLVNTQQRAEYLPSFFRSLTMPGSTPAHISLTDYRGRPIASNGQLRTYGHEAWFQQVMSGIDHTAITPAGLVLAVPVMYANRPEGALVVQLSATATGGFLAAAISAGRRLLVDGEGHVLASSVPEFPSGSSAAPLQQMNQAAGRPGEPVPSQQTLWVASVPVRAFGKGLRVWSIDDYTRLAVQQVALTKRLLTELTLFLSVLVLGIIMTGQLMRRPVLNLIQQVQAIDLSNLPHEQVSESGPQETVQLATAFNQVLKNLQETTVSREALNEKNVALLQANLEREELMQQLSLQKETLDRFAIVVETDARGVITYANDRFCEISGYSREEILGHTHRLVNSGFHSKSFYTNLWQTIRAGRVWQGEIQNRAKDGSLYWVDTTIVPFLDKSKKPLKYMAVRVLITDRKLAEAERERLNQELQKASRQAGMAEIATGVLHNVGNVLNSVNVGIGLLQQRYQDTGLGSLQRAAAMIQQHENDLGRFLTQDTRGKHFTKFFTTTVAQLARQRELQAEELDALADNIHHIEQIISSQQSHAKLIGVIERTNMSVIVQQSLAAVEGDLRQDGITLRRDFAAPAEMETDPHRVMQVIVNLVSNARDAILQQNGPTREIVVAIAYPRADRVTVQVTDSGIGIAEQHLQLIFNHGFTTRSRGHGFGLHDCALAAQQLGGQLHAESAGIGQGATFTFELPLRTPAATKGWHVAELAT